jgi:copper chaperone CopZ
MEQVIYKVPNLYGDHHVLTVREAITGLEGVESVYASSAWNEVMVRFDPGKIQASAIESALNEAGYPIGDGKPPVLVEADSIKRDPRWKTLGVRATQTYQADLDMSGEHRRY